MNKLYFADCLDVMKRLYHQEHKTEFIDLVYIDPPFNSKRNYNVLFESAEINDTIAQKEAFTDTWSNVSYLDTFYLLKGIDLNLHNFLNALDNIGISKSAISYLATMAIRIKYIHRLLKPTGAFFLHCDPTMSHYLKIVCDLIFGEKNYRNEIVWHYGQRTDNYKFHLSRKHDIIFLYGKSDKFILNQTSISWNKEEFIIKRHDVKIDDDGREFIWTDGGKGKVRYKRFVDDVLKEGKPLDDVWEIPILNSAAKERLGYPTQKPEALMERIIQASSKEGDLVADFFCGCGTTIAAAQKLNRSWIGSDISHLAVKLISKRLVETYGENIKTTFEIHGFPKDLDSARELAARVKGGRLLFEEWIVEVMLHGILNEKRNQMGYDGHFTFDMNGVKNVALIEVKSGGASPTQLNHFIRTLEDRKANMGIFVCFAEEVTDNMRRISKQQGLFHPDYKYPKIQILTVEEILEGKQPDRPASRVETFKQAEKKIISDANQKKLEF